MTIEGEGEKEKEVIILGDRNDEIKIDGDASPYKLQGVWTPASPMLNININGHSVTMQYHGSAYLGSLSLQAFGTVYDVRVRTALEKSLLQYLPATTTFSSERLVMAPMAGQIVSVAVKEGDVVREGGELLVIEAMKMQNVLRAPKAAKIAKLHVEQGKNVASDQCLLELEFL